VTNLTDSHYYSYVNDLASSTGFETARPGEPRMFGGRIRYHFGN
jgi:iron complex outermembrane receptor protein